MNSPEQEHTFSRESRENETSPFLDKFRELLPGINFEESAEMREARLAIVEALARKDPGPDFIKSVWVEYAKICEQTVDSKTEMNPQFHAQLQIATLVHKALIFREAGNIQRYGEDLSDAEEYAFNANLSKPAEAIGAELDKLSE